MPRRPDVELRDGIVIVSATEDLDIASADLFLNAALARVPNDALGVVVDLSRARYVDSAGIRALFAISDALSRRQLLFHVSIPPDAAIRRVLRVVRLDTAAEIFEDLDQAVIAAQAASA